LEELIKFCESKNLIEVVVGLKKDLKTLTAPPTGTKSPKNIQEHNKENQERTLAIIRKAIKADDLKKMREDNKE
jgi:hypothetical protein